jgi:hypothetical protein
MRTVNDLDGQEGADPNGQPAAEARPWRRRMSMPGARGLQVPDGTIQVSNSS